MIYVWLCLAAFAAGVVNAVAGGGTLLTFPALAGVMPEQLKIANASSTLCLFPASLASVWGYRAQLPACRRWILWLAGPSLVGAALGAVVLMLFEESTFRLIVPWLILLAAVLFLLQPTIGHWLKAHAAAHEADTRTLVGVVILQFVIGVYAGYFGAGIGILMLSALSFLGLADIHHVNALKSTMALLMNIGAAILFTTRGMVAWEYVLPMALTSIVGGYVGARLALRVPVMYVRWLIIVIAFGLAVYYFLSLAT